MRSSRRFVRTTAALVCTMLAGALLAIAPVNVTPAGADLGQFMWLNEDGGETATYGPNSIVSISLGAIAYQCDTFFSAADIYVVSGTPGDGATLDDASGGKNTAIGSWGGGIIDEIIAVTQPSGNLGEGTYSVVYDECQDGKFDADLDAVFVDAITVEMPEGELPPADPAIAAMKGDAQIRATQMAYAGHSLKLMEMLVNAAAKNLCKTGNLVACLYRYYLKGTKGVIKAARDAAADSASHWQGIADDPPDPGFDVVSPPVLPTLPADQTTDTPLDAAIRDLTAMTATDAALAESLLHSIERYQGADAANNPNAALLQSRAAQDAADALVAISADEAAGMDRVADLIASSPLNLDAAAAEVDAAVQQIQIGGIPEGDRADLRSLGFDDAAIDAMGDEIATEDLVGWSRDRMVAELRDQADIIEQSAPVLANFSAEMADLEAILALNPVVGATGPEVDAGGPYSVSVGATVDLAATQTSPGSGGTTFAWDLDLDGAFDDATGATPTVPAPAADGLFAVQITDSNGDTDWALAEINLVLPGSAPVLTLVSPATPDAEVAVGGSATFEVSVTDPDGPAPEVHWFLDGVDVGTGLTYGFGPATAGQIGQHDLHATVVDGPHTRRIDIALDVVAADADVDGWHSNVDCDDADADINPGEVEIQGNGIDDDCNPATTDEIANRAPVANNTFVGTLEDTPVAITLPATDPDGDTLTYLIVDPPATGSLGAVTGNQVTYTPVTGASGAVTFTFQASDGEFDSDTKTVTVNIAAVDDLPVVADVAAVTDEDVPVMITLDGVDPDADPLVYSIVSPPAAGTLGPIAGDQVQFTPPADASGSFTFTYDVTAGATTSPPATVTVQVLAVDDAPVAAPVAPVVTDEDTDAMGNLAVSDPDGDPLERLILDGPAHGTLVVEPDGDFTYTPAPNYNGPDSFTWLAFDGSSPSNEVTVDVTVNPVDDLPAIDDVAASTAEDTPINVRMEGTDADHAVTFAIVTPPTNGTLATISGRRVVYTPNAEYSGPDSFTYTVTGGAVTAGPATASITVTPVNDPPKAVDEAATTNNGAPVTVDVLANDSDFDGGALSVLTLGLPASGSAFTGAVGMVTYTPPVGFSGVVNVPYTVSDGLGGTSDATLTVLVTEGPVESETWTNETDFTSGESFNVEQIGPNDLTIKDEAAAFARLWVAVSSKGTIVKFDTDTNAIIGEYRAAPAGMPLNPSRTTVDLNGNVWATSRDGNSVVQIGLVENGQCEDRNDNGVIDTSTGFNDIRAWPNTGGIDSDGGVETAEDECIRHFVRVSTGGTRHVSVTADNDVWVSGTSGNRVFDLIDGETGAIVRSEGPVGYGGYGGLIDPNGVVWSSTWPYAMLRWDTSLPLTGPAGGNWSLKDAAYGLCLDPYGNVWGTYHGSDVIRKYAPDGTLLGSFPQGNPYAQGCAAGADGDIWVAHSLTGQTTVGHLKNDGTYVGTITVGAGPTGVAVDANGFVWSTNYNAGTVSKIDPNAGPVGLDGETPVGEVVFTSAFLDGYPYNYSDMTGSTLTGIPQSGTWTGVFDSGEAANTWAAIAWEEVTPCDSKITVRAATSEDGVTYTLYEPVENGELPTVDPGRYLKVEATLIRCSTGENALLRDLTAWTTSPLAPMAEDNQTTTPEETPVVVTLEADTQPTPGGELTYEIIKAPSYGTIGAINPDGTVTYTPGPNYNGYDSIGFRVDDGALRSDPAYSVIEVTPLNDPPVAVGQAVEVDYQTPKVIDLEATDVDGDELAFVQVDAPAHGDLTGLPDGTVTYTPDAGYVGPDSFTFQADDDAGGDAPGRPRGTRALSNTATVTIDVGPTVPGPPIDVSAIGGNQNARVQWETPLTDGGSPITGYEVRIVGTDTSIEVGIDPLIVIFGGLANDTEYQFEVRAENAVGYGPYSEASNVTKPRPACDTDAFTDVDKDHPFCPEIKWMADNDIARGYEDGSYRPTAQVTRQAMAAFVYRMAGQELGPNPTCAEKPFPDVPVDHVFCGEIQWMADEGISTGFPDGTYKPRLPITRMAMSAFLYRLSGSPNGDDPACTADEFPDVPMEHPFCGEIDWMVDSGLASGFENGTFRPGAAITRQAMAAFLFRYNVLTGIVG